MGLLRQPEAIFAVCREIGYTGWRDRVLTPVTALPCHNRGVPLRHRSSSLTMIAVRRAVRSYEDGVIAKHKGGDKCANASSGY